MAKKETDEDRQNSNLKVFHEWLNKHGNLIMPIPNRGVIYAGFGKTNLMKAKKGLQADPVVTPMWKILEKVEKDARQYSGYVTIDHINDVLKRLKSPLPKLVEATGANAGHPKKYSDMLSCVEALANDKWALIPSRDQGRVWNLVSEKYAENLRGEVQIWEGAGKRFGLLERYKVMLQTELKTIRKNPNVSAETRKNVENLIKKYEKHYGELGREAAANDKSVKESLKKAMRRN